MTDIEKSLVTAMNNEFRMLLQDNKTVLGEANTLGTTVWKRSHSNRKDTGLIQGSDSIPKDRQEEMFLSWEQGQ